ncbi:MAG: hypothetical protein AB8G22_20815 [Saprospiraceae bacterium]
MQIKQFFLSFLFVFAALLSTSVNGQDGQQTVSEYEARQQAIALAEQAKVNVIERERALQETLVKRDFYKKDLKEKNRTGNVSKQDIKLIKLELGKVEQEVSLAAKKVKSANFWAKETQNMIGMTKKKRNKLLEKYGIKPNVVSNMTSSTEPKIKTRKLSKIEAAERELAAIKTRERFEDSQPKIETKVEGTITNPKLVTTEIDQSSQAEKETPNLLTDLPKKAARTNVDFVQYDPAQNTFLNPPDYKCKIEFTGIDRFSGKARTDLKPEPLFYYTDEQLRPYLKDKDYLTAEVYLSRLEGGYHFLTLVIKIASKNAQLEYGNVERGSLLSFRTLEGKTIKVQANKTAAGQYNLHDDSFTYRIQYVLTGGAKKMLEEELIDQVRLTWSRGYEEYEVFEVDLIQQQFACLKQ